MDKVTVLIAVGANDIMVPCRLFENLVIGKQICDEIFGMEGEQLESRKVIRYRPDLDNEDEEAVISNQLFTHFCYGCGGICHFILQEVPFNTKFIGFDLD